MLILSKNLHWGIWFLAPRSSLMKSWQRFHLLAFAFNKGYNTERIRALAAAGAACFGLHDHYVFLPLRL